MKYPSIKKEGQQVLHIDPIKKGVNFSTVPYFSEGDLSDCKNVIFSSGSLKTRPGISANEENIIRGESSDQGFISNYTLSDTVVVINGTEYRIATERTELYSEQYAVMVFFISSSGEVINAGQILFQRLSSEVFYIPKNITFFQGSPQTGGGIFAFVTCHNTENGNDLTFEIFEVNSTFDGWNGVYDYYIPTVYINGRGNKYEAMEAQHFAFTGTPAVLEAPNLLTGRFYAYYSSDGYSSDFTLPFSNLSDTNILCRIHTSLNEYTEWVVYEKSNTCTTKFFGVDVTMNVDRGKGLVYFTSPTGDYPIPLMSRYMANNIRLSATKRSAISFKDVVSSTCSLVADSRIFLSGGTKSNGIYVARYENPLYFPQSDAIEVGESRQSVTALLFYNQKLLAFKKSEIFILTLKKGEAINTKSLLADNDAVFYKTDSISLKKLSYGIGCDNRNAITLLKDKAVWFSTDGNVYAMNTSMKIAPISRKVHTVLNGLDSRIIKTAAAVNDGRHCMFFFENIALVCKISANIDEADTAWYVWEFPSRFKVLGGIDKPTPLLYCVNKYSTCYLAKLKGNKDCLVTYKNTGSYTEENNIFSSISTACYSPEGKNIKKRLNKIYMQLGAKGEAVIKINGKRVDLGGLKLTNDSEDFRKVTIFPEISSFSSVYITVSASKHLNLGDIDVFYNKLI